MMDTFGPQWNTWHFKKRQTTIWQLVKSYRGELEQQTEKKFVES